MIGSTSDPKTCPSCGRASLRTPDVIHLCDVHQELGLHRCPEPLTCSSCQWRGCEFVASALRGGDEALALLRTFKERVS